MSWKKIVKAFLYPHAAVAIALIPVATVFLVCSMVFLGTESLISIISYVLAAYTLTVWCFRIPRIIEFWARFRNENKYMIRWRSDARLRVKVSLYGTLAWNSLYGALQLWLGIYHHTFWFASLGIYYVCLAAMRYFLLGHTRRHAPGEERRVELLKYRNCGWVLLFMSLALSLIVFFMVYWNRTFVHHMITTIAMAAYTFTSLTFAIINLVRYRKYDSPVFSAAKVISFAAALVSMLTLESTMLTVFGDGSMSDTERGWMLGATGGAVCTAVIAMAVFMIVQGIKKLKQINKEEQNG